MTNDDFKNMLDKALGPVNQSLDKLSKKQAEFREELSGVKGELNGVKEDQSDLRKLIEERVLPPLIYIENTVKSYADRYVANEDHIRRLDKRLNTVEDNLGITPPEDLSIPPAE